MSKRTMTPTEARQEQENETNEILLAEDAVQTTAYLVNTPECCSGAEQLDHVLGMLGADAMNEDVITAKISIRRCPCEGGSNERKNEIPLRDI